MTPPKKVSVDCPHCSHAHSVTYRVQASPYMRSAPFSSPRREVPTGTSDKASFQRYVTCPKTNQRFKVTIELSGRGTEKVDDVEIEGVEDDSS